MPTPSEAEEHLRAIRSLMERSTIYRAISAPVALIGGICTLLACAVITLRPIDPDTINRFFISCWLLVLAVTALANTYLLWRDATRRGEPFISSGMRAALWALGPNFLVSGAATYVLANAAYMLPSIWMMFYGLALLATQHFAPRSIALLGWGFLAAGILSILVPFLIGLKLTFGGGWSLANMEMGATFGLFHIIYAACTWPQKNKTTPAGAEP